MIKILTNITFTSISLITTLCGSSMEINEKNLDPLPTKRGTIGKPQTIHNDPSDRNSFQDNANKLVLETFKALTLKKIKIKPQSGLNTLEALSVSHDHLVKYKDFENKLLDLYIIASIGVELKQDPSALCFYAYFQEAHGNNLKKEIMNSSSKKSKNKSDVPLEEELEFFYAKAQSLYTLSCNKSCVQAQERLYWILKKGGIGRLPNEEKAKDHYPSCFEHKDENNAFVTWLEECLEKKPLNIKKADILIATAIKKAKEFPCSSEGKDEINTEVSNKKQPNFRLTLLSPRSWNPSVTSSKPSKNQGGSEIPNHNKKKNRQNSIKESTLFGQGGTTTKISKSHRRSTSWHGDEEISTKTPPHSMSFLGFLNPRKWRKPSLSKEPLLSEHPRENEPTRGTQTEIINTITYVKKETKGEELLERPRSTSEPYLPKKKY